MLQREDLDKLKTLVEKAGGGFVVKSGEKPELVIMRYEVFQQFASRRELRIGQSRESSNKGEGYILVTGGAGYIGSHTVRELVRQGRKVVVLDNLSAGHREFVPAELMLIEADIRDAERVDALFSQYRFDAVIHFAAAIEVEESVRDPRTYYDVNVKGSLNLLNAMVEHDVRKMVFSSSAAVYGEPKTVPIPEYAPTIPTNPYGETKVTFEQALRWYVDAYGISSVSLRYFNAAGAAPDGTLGRDYPNDTQLIPRLMHVAIGRSESAQVYGTDYATADGTAVRDYIHVLDLAQAHILALDFLEKHNGAHVYNVGTGTGYSVREVIEKAIEVTKHMIPVEQAPRRPGDPAILVADSSRLQQDWGWKPRYSDLRTILASAWEWHKNRFGK